MLTRSRGLESDLATLLIAAGAQVCLKIRFKGIFLSARGLFYPSADARPQLWPRVRPCSAPDSRGRTEFRVTGICFTARDLLAP